MDERWDARVERLATPRECAIFERNARERSRDDLAEQARHRWVELSTDALVEGRDADPLQRDLWQALAASEYVLGRSATGTRQVIRRRGLVRATEHLVCNGELAAGLAGLDAAGLRTYAWESAVLRHPEAFSEAAAKCARATIDACPPAAEPVEAGEVTEAGA